MVFIVFTEQLENNFKLSTFYNLIVFVSITVQNIKMLAQYDKRHCLYSIPLSLQKNRLT